MGEVWRGRDSRIGREVAPDGTATRIEPLPPMPDPKKRFQTPALSPDGKRFAGATGQPVGGGVPGMWLYELETKRYEQLSAAAASIRSGCRTASASYSSTATRQR